MSTPSRFAGAAAWLALTLAACGPGAPDPDSPLQACLLTCAHIYEAGCSSNVSLTDSAGGCGPSCVSGVDKLKPACAELYVIAQQCYGSATLRCDARDSVNTSIGEQCAEENKAVRECSTANP